MKTETLKDIAESIQNLPADADRIPLLAATVERANALVRDQAKRLAVDAAPADHLRVLLEERDSDR
ncbi:MAG: hypothetical protein QF902_07870 [Rhodospirillales bacterium]|nr:hypothetical protein [Rhodospirillales bacterium]